MLTTWNNPIFFQRIAFLHKANNSARSQLRQELAGIWTSQVGSVDRDSDTVKWCLTKRACHPTRQKASFDPDLLFQVHGSDSGLHLFWEYDLLTATLMSLFWGNTFHSFITYPLNIS